MPKSKKTLKKPLARLSLEAPPIAPSMKPLGILGGGQLARMMALKAHEMGIPVQVLTPHSNDPAAQVAPRTVLGALGDRAKLKEFLSSCSVVTFESEFLDADLLKELSQQTQTEIWPEASEMGQLQDRLLQKQILLDAKLPTAEFVAVDSPASAEEAFLRFGGKVVFKKRRFGYDGYGTYKVRSQAELKTFISEVERPSLVQVGGGFIAERFIPFQKELAIMIARSKNGQTIQLPFVETFQENSRCLWVKGPLRNSSALTSLGKKLEGFLKERGYVGVMGVELFQTAKGLLINELAPRVHNSGHYSLEALSLDQFSLHLKCVLGLPIEKPRLLTPGFAMMNLLGSSDQSVSWHLKDDVHLHWYGKSENRAGRKMGHFTILDSTPDRALAKARTRRSSFDV